MAKNTSNTSSNGTNSTTSNKKETFLQALKLNLGNITEACKASNTGRQTYYNWVDDDEEFKHYTSEFNNLLKRSNDTLNMYKEWDLELKTFENHYNILKQRYDNMNKESMEKSNKSKKRSEEVKEDLENAISNS